MTADGITVSHSPFHFNALSWDEVEKIMRRFDSLSPYNCDDVPHLLRLTDENLDAKGIHASFSGYR